MRNWGFMRCCNTALSVKGQILDLEGKLTEHYTPGSKSYFECCGYLCLYGFARTKDRSSGFGVKSQVVKRGLHAKAPIPYVGTLSVSPCGCVLCCVGGVAHLEVAWRSECSTCLHSVDEHFSSGGPNTVTVPMPAWALGSLQGLPWNQGVNFFSTHEMYSAYSRNIHTFCVLSEDTVCSNIDELVIWDVKRNTQNETQNVLENEQRVKSLELEVRRLLTLPWSLCETLHNSCYLSASVSPFINHFLLCIIWTSSCLGSFEH